MAVGSLCFCRFLRLYKGPYTEGALTQRGDTPAKSRAIMVGELPRKNLDNYIGFGAPAPGVCG